MGRANYHARVRFAENGSTWLIRVPRINNSIPQQLIDYLIRSEYATLKFLETTKVPAPRAFGYGIAGDTNNRVGISYILMEEMPGKPWNRQGPRGKRSADNKDKEKVRNGLADILIELKKYEELFGLVLGPMTPKFDGPEQSYPPADNLHRHPCFKAIFGAAQTFDILRWMFEERQDILATFVQRCAVPLKDARPNLIRMRARR
jgi:hypothetical protein